MGSTTYRGSTAGARTARGCTVFRWVQERIRHTKSLLYSFQYDDHKIVSGLRDNTIKMWDRQTLQQHQRVLTGHTGSVLCLQYDEKVIISGSSDSTVRVWDVESGEMVNTLIHHCEAVLHLSFNFKFCNGRTDIKAQP